MTDWPEKVHGGRPISGCSGYICSTDPSILFKEIIISFRAYGAAHRFIRRNNLWKWIVIPGLVYLILFLAGGWFYLHTVNRVVEYILSVSGLSDWLQKNPGNFLRFLIFFGQVVLHLVLLLLYLSWFKYFFLILGSPVFAYLSEKTESILIKTDFPFSFSKLLRDAWRGIRLSVRNAFWQTLFVLLMIMLAWVPVVGWVTPVVSIIVECYYLGFAMIDYTSERRGFGVARSIAFVNRHRGLAIGNGMVFYGMLLIPVIGWVLAPGYAVVAATLALQEPDE